MKKLTQLLALTLVLVFSPAGATELTWKFKNPAFHYGNGYSTHVLSVEQLQHNRKQELRKEADAEARRIERELENSVLNKFIRNLESRIYATLSKQMVDAMFADCGDTCANTGTADVEGNTISWIKDPVTGSITLTITGEDGSVTEITIPGLGEFNF
jgi:hypothetical protein|tara:strand:+ start:304 stop:774 length:471 start_codon:yes stop_codon:yes gene_type:complete